MRIGASLSGLEYGPFDGVYGKDYISPIDSMGPLVARGFKLFRVMFLWERLQPKWGMPLASEEVAPLRSILDEADVQGAKVILCPWADGSKSAAPCYRNQTLRAPAEVGALSDFWWRMNAQFASHPALEAFDLFNEPEGFLMGYGWPQMVRAISESVPGVPLIVEGTGWGTIFSDDLRMTFASNPKITFSIHLYPGNQKNDYRNAASSDVVAGAASKPFTDFLYWCKGAPTQIGEIGCPPLPNYLAELRAVLDLARASRVDVLAWNAGPWVSPDDPLNLLAPQNKVRLDLLASFAGG